MANIAVFASGNGSNFQSIAEALQSSSHQIYCVICDNPDAYVITRARSFDIPCHLVTYCSRSREQAEETILSDIHFTRNMYIGVYLSVISNDNILLNNTHPADKHIVPNYTTFPDRCTIGYKTILHNLTTRINNCIMTNNCTFTKYCSW